MSEVRWQDIVAECGDYRGGFVAVFRRYEGQTTDELDGQGRWIKVTGRSFAEHMGIPERTFRRWIKTAAAADLPPSEQQGRRDERFVRSAVTRMSPEQRADLGRQLLREPEVMDEALRQIDEQERKATAHHPRSTTPRHPEAQPQGGIIGTKANQMAWMAIEKAIGEAQGSIRRAVRAYDAGNFELTPEATAYLNECIGALRDDVTMLEAALHNRVKDGELAAFLAGGE